MGVRKSTWWGRFLLAALDCVRIPFTSFGFHYDLNHHVWHGPDMGNTYHPQ